MTQVIAEPRPELKPHAPRIEMLTIPKEMIGALIGPGGKLSRRYRGQPVPQLLLKRLMVMVMSISLAKMQRLLQLHSTGLKRSLQFLKSDRFIKAK